MRDRKTPLRSPAQAMPIPTLKIARYPNLRLLAWQFHGDRIPEDQAFAIYEREWRHLDPNRLGAEERELIERLNRAYGHGVLNL
jgi:hypothetical protein